MKTMDSMDELGEAIRIVRAAGGLLMDNIGCTLDVKIKEDKSPCTQIDRLSSDYIFNELSKSFPDYGIVDEERTDGDLSRIIGPGRYTWIVDPLDSTVSYMRKDNNFGVLIGLLYGDRPILGIAYRPMIDEMVYAVKGRGAYLEHGGKSSKLEVSASAEPTILVSMFRNNSEINMLESCFGSDNIRHMPSAFKSIEIAKGTATGFCCPASNTMNIWDVCAAEVIVTESGGRFTDVYDAPINYSEDTVIRNGLIASNSVLHDTLLDALAGRHRVELAKDLYS